MAGVTAFREAYVNQSASTLEQFDSWTGRQVRYAILRSYFDNSAYRNIHVFSNRYKAEFGLYKHTRPIYNPAYSLTTFWQTHLFGGKLDMHEAASGALPIVTENSNLPQAVAHLWRDSNWQVNKDLFTLNGAMYGDCFARVIDAPDKGRVWLDVLQPACIESIEIDNVGNVKAYTLVENRYHPDNDNRAVEYRETAERDGESVVYRTYLNGALYAWSENGAEWDEPYGFIPMVYLQHNNVGSPWGFSEMQPALAVFREIDDIASKVSDQIRKTVDPRLAVLNVEKPTTTPVVTGRTADSTNLEPAREELPIMYFNSNTGNADIKPILGDLNIADALTHLNSISEKLERDYPELRLTRLLSDGANMASGEALRRAQQPAAEKVLSRRANYDDALVRLQKMAVAIGGWRGYTGYAGFGLDSYTAGDLEHEIGDRAVFGQSETDKLQEEKLFWETAKRAVESNYQLDLWLKRQGWSDEKLAELKASPQYRNATFATYPGA